jgi:LmbE family N-acetylglucosaminyl deacetylase
MQHFDRSRRKFVKQALAAAGLGLMAAPALLSGSADSVVEAKRLKIVCVGGHPDDPESGCAGILTRYAALGHGVTVIYLTRGERGIRGKSIEEAAQTRSAECEAACKIMGAKAVFAGQIDGATELNHERVDASLLAQAKAWIAATRRKP